MKQPTRGRITLRTAGASDAKKLYALIQANLEEGHLLPRTLTSSPVMRSVRRRGQALANCRLRRARAPEPHVAEVRSLAVDASARGSRVGVAIVDELRLRAPGRKLRKALRVHARAALLHFTWLLDRAAPLADGEGVPRLASVPAVSPLRQYAMCRAARRGVRRRTWLRASLGCRPETDRPAAPLS